MGEMERNKREMLIPHPTIGEYHVVRIYVLSFSKCLFITLLRPLVHCGTSLIQFKQLKRKREH